MYEQAGAPGREGGTLFSVAGSLRDPNRFKFDSQMPMVLAGGSQTCYGFRRNPATLQFDG